MLNTVIASKFCKINGNKLLGHNAEKTRLRICLSDKKENYLNQFFYVHASSNLLYLVIARCFGCSDITFWYSAPNRPSRHFSPS